MPFRSRDIERALGMAPNKNFVIVTNRTKYSESIKLNFPDFVHLVDLITTNTDAARVVHNTQDLWDTAQLLKSDTARKLIDQPNTAVMVFKNTTLIETIVKENGWTLLNPKAELAEKIENKITQIEWLGELAKKYLPPHEITLTKNLIWKKEPLIIQWGHGHTGLGTLLINSQKEIDELKQKFPERTARASSFINGPSFTINVVVGQKVLPGNISYQITGLPPFTDNVFSTIGNDWSLTHSILSESEIEDVHTMATDIGTLMMRDGWKGLFGLDFIRDNEREKINLIEINARQPASTTFESQLQEENRRNGVVGSTIFESHCLALFASKNESDTSTRTVDLIVHINDGAQIIQRLTKKIAASGTGIMDDVKGSLRLAGYNVIEYQNTGINDDLIRIQSSMGIMETHGKFNARGKEIMTILSEGTI